MSEQTRQLLGEGGEIHHAYVLEGDSSVILPELLLWLKETATVDIVANPDLRVREYETFTVDDSRHLRQEQSTKSSLGGKKVFIINTSFITPGAQNALLKVFEEPTPDTHLFLIVPVSEVLLSTLLSRVVLVRMGGADAATRSIARDFIMAGKDVRMEMVKKIAKDKDKVASAALLGDIERELYEYFKTDPKKYADSLMEVEKGRRYLFGSSPSVKNILEHLALTIPAF